MSVGLKLILQPMSMFDVDLLNTTVGDMQSIVGQHHDANSSQYWWQLTLEWP